MNPYIEKFAPLNTNVHSSSLTLKAYTKSKECFYEFSNKDAEVLYRLLANGGEWVAHSSWLYRFFQRIAKRTAIKFEWYYSPSVGLYHVSLPDTIALLHYQPAMFKC